jgi:hypothetical protein
VPEPGRYLYDVTGSSSLGPVPATASLTVEGLGAHDQRWTTDHRDGQGRGSVEVLTLSAQDDGLHLLGYRVDHTTSLGSLTLDFLPGGDPVFLPHNLSPGQGWSFDLRSRDGCTTAHTTATAKRMAEDTTVEGAPVKADVVALSTVVTSSGAAGCASLDLRLERTSWFSRESRLPYRDERRLDGRYAGFPVRSETTAVLRSARPDTG